MNYKWSYGVAALVFAASAHAQIAQDGCANQSSTTCSSSNQQVGNVSPTAAATNSTSISTQAGNSANANGASVGGTFNNNPQQEQSIGNAAQTIGPNQQSATGGSATGNLSNNSNDNRSNATTGASNSGGNNLSTGASTSGAVSGGNTLATGPSNASVGAVSSNAAGGAGGAGGTGGTATGGAGGTASGGTARQGQQQGQTQAANANGTNRSSNTNSIGQSVGNGQSTNVGGSSYSDNSRTIFIPPVVPPTPPSTVGTPQVIQTTTACGPLQQVIKTPVIGTYFGMFTNDKIEQGFTYDLAPVLDNNYRQVSYREEIQSNGDIKQFGSQAIIFATVVSIAGARTVAIGGGSSGGSWGQGGGGSSAAMSQLVTNIQIHECEIGTLHFVPIQTVAPIIETPVQQLKRKIVRRHIVKGCLPK